jgi:hypothetical protein
MAAELLQVGFILLLLLPLLLLLVLWAQKHCRRILL